MQLSRARGAMLLELLVALLLTGLAVLALTGAQAAAVKASRLSLHRVMAAQLAADLGERLRANPAGALLDLGEGSPYRLAMGWAAQQAAGSLSAAPRCEGAAANCSPLAFSQADVAQWRELVARQLPSGAAHVSIDAAQALADIWVAWREPQAFAADESPRAAAECPAAWGAETASGVRCLHVRMAW